jgi:signal transduction histidine kinase
MKPVYISLLLLASTLSLGQTTEAERIKRLLSKTRSDTSRVLLQVELAHSYLFFQLDSSLILAQQALQQARKLTFARGEWKALNEVGVAQNLRGELILALETQFQALQICRTSGDLECEARTLIFIGTTYVQLSEYHEGLRYLRKACKINDHIQKPNIFAFSNIGGAYQNMNQLDSAWIYQQQAYGLLKGLPPRPLNSLILIRLGVIQAQLGNNRLALRYYQAALANSSQMGDLINQARAHNRMAEVYHQLQQRDSSLSHARLAFIQPVSKLTLLQVSNLLVKLHEENGNKDSAFHYLQIAMATKDIMFGPEKFQRLQLLTLTEQQRQQQLLQEQARLEDRFQRIGLLSGLGFLLMIALLLGRNNRQQQKTNRELNQKNNQIETQRETLETTLAELKTTQTQLIEKEKINSLYQQQLKVQQVRNKIASELHDDIGSTLSSIYLFSEVAKKEINQDSLQALPMLEKIENSSQQMMQSMSEIVWAIQPKNDDTANLVEKIHSFANELLATRHIRFRFEYPDQFLSIPIAMEVRRNIYLIFKETLNNIAKHSQATQVDMEVEIEEKNIRISIQDNGQGFDTHSTSNGNGLRNLCSRAEEIGGRLRIDSQLGLGTGIYLQCPLP